uniref:uncharacterized protein LOC117609687 n=1 Tax=Osmia lignaria TaxID=473952 RepID=UPI0014782AA6|nr:uncharacterized protein LOC117609687 [Osmia lignaria]
MSLVNVTLFLIVINDACRITEPPVITRIFADDITIICKGKSLNTSQHTIQSALNKLHDWSKNNGLKFTATKTECILFSNHHEAQMPVLKLGTNLLRSVTCTKLLGVFFDSKLTWSNHINNLADNCKQRIKIIKSLAHNNWGADKTVLLQAYKAIVRSKIDYASVIYDSAKPNLLRKLDVIHNMGLRIATGSFHTSPIGSIMIEAGKTSLQHRRKLLSIKYAARASTSTNPIIYGDIFSRNRHQAEHQAGKITSSQRIKSYLSELEFSLPDMEKSRFHNAPPWTLNALGLDLSLVGNKKEELTTEEWKRRFNTLCDKYPDFIHIYTNGSKNKFGTGAAMVTQNETTKLGLNPFNSILTAETYALLLALNFIDNSLYSKFIIFSDSLSTILKIQNTKQTMEMYIVIQEIYDRLIKARKTIIVAWILSHVDIHGNVMADLEAKIASTLHMESQSLLNTSVDIIQHIKSLWKQPWNRTWRNYKASPLHKSIDNFYDLTTNLNFNRKQQVAITRIRTGHSKLSHSHLLNNSHPSLCEICNTPLTINHIILEC